jgi:hypothetical protein
MMISAKASPVNDEFNRARNGTGPAGPCWGDRQPNSRWAVYLESRVYVNSRRTGNSALPAFVRLRRGEPGWIQG